MTSLQGSYKSMLRSVSKIFQLDIVMYSMISDGTIEDDPFRESRNLTINLIEAEYKKFGTSRTLVKCQFTPGGHGSGTYHTMPQYKIDGRI